MRRVLLSIVSVNCRNCLVCPGTCCLVVFAAECRTAARLRTRISSAALLVPEPPTFTPDRDAETTKGDISNEHNQRLV